MQEHKGVTVLLIESQRSDRRMHCLHIHMYMYVQVQCSILRSVHVHVLNQFFGWKFNKELAEGDE